MSMQPMPKPEMITAALAQIEARHDLSRDEAETLMEELLAGRMAQPEVVRFLLAMRAKGETVEELVGFARVMRRHATPIPLAQAGTALAPGGASLDEWPLVDTCGTGGGTGGTFNVSTAAALVVAGAGVRVAKHGNRSMSGLTSSSLCGSADVVEALGVNLDLEPAQVTRCVDEIGRASCRERV